MDTTLATIRCHRVAITLTMDEQIVERFILPATHTTNTLTAAAATAASSSRSQHVHGEYHQYGALLSSCDALFSVPKTCTPTFSTDHIHVTWALHFKFIVDVPPTLSSSSSAPSNTASTIDSNNMALMLLNTMMPPPSSGSGGSGSSSGVESLQWTLPLHVMANHSFNRLRHASHRTLQIDVAGTSTSSSTPAYAYA